MLIAPAPCRALLLLGVTLSLLPGCQRQQEPEPEPTQEEIWFDEAEAHGPMGRPGSADLDVTQGLLEVHSILGRVEADLSAPFTVHGDAWGARAALHNVTIADVGQGTLLVVGDLRVDEGTLGAARLGTIEITTDAVNAQVVRQNDPLDELVNLAEPPPGFSIQTSNVSEMRALQAELSGATITPQGGAMLLIDDEDPIVLEEQSYTIEGGELFVSEGATLAFERINLAPERFGFAGEITGGTLRAGDDTVSAPGPVFGQGGTLVLEPGAFVAEATSITQAITDDGPAFPAEVELEEDRVELQVGPGEVARPYIVLREASFEADAVLNDLVVTEGDEEAISIAADQPNSMVRDLWEGVEDAGVAAPLVAIPAIVLTPIAVVGDLLCLLGCGSSSGPSPFPAWIDAGRVTGLSVHIQAPEATGTYEWKLLIDGANYDDVEVTYVVTVEANDD